MSNKIRIGICGYGNIGRAVETVISNFPDMELLTIFTRRDSVELQSKIMSNAVVDRYELMESWKDEIDVMIMCGGSDKDLPVQVPEVCKIFNTVDSFDTHKNIPDYFEEVDVNATAYSKTSVISGGWDPGLFSLMRLYGNAFLPQGGDKDGRPYCFWGLDKRGFSQGHSNAIKEIKGVKGAAQYTIIVKDAIDRVRKGEHPEFTARQMHTRNCFVALDYSTIEAESAEEFEKKKAILEQEIEQKIKTNREYFADYDTTVHFITEEELRKNHREMAHGGSVIQTAETGNGHKHKMELSLSLDSNPEFTASILLALARATYRMSQAGQYGAKTIFDIPPAMLSAMSAEELRKKYL